MARICNLVVLTVLTVAGCAGPATQPLPRQVAGISAGEEALLIRFESTPMGARVLRNGVLLGQTPFGRAEAVTRVSGNGAEYFACKSSEPVTFVWESGATTMVTDLCAHYPRVMAERPADVAGLKRDLRVEAGIRSRTPAGYIAPASRSRAGDPPPAYAYPGDAWHNNHARAPARGVVSGLEPDPPVMTFAPTLD